MKSHTPISLIYALLIVVLVAGCSKSKNAEEVNPYPEDQATLYNIIEESYPGDAPRRSDTISPRETVEEPVSAATVRMPVGKLSRYYEEGYDAGYEDGIDDASAGYQVLYSFDDITNYKGQAAKEYCLGYEEGYDDGYNAGCTDDEEENEYW